MTVSSEQQKLVTEAVLQYVEFDFTTIGRSNKVHITSDHNEPTYFNYVDPTQVWVDGNTYTFKRVDFSMSGLRSDLTGQIAEPTLTVAADSLWALPEWTSATDGMSLLDYRGVRVSRQRTFYNILTYITPQVYFIKHIDEFNADRITFTLTPTLGGENLNQPSARKLEL